VLESLLIFIFAGILTLRKRHRLPNKIIAFSCLISRGWKALYPVEMD